MGETEKLKKKPDPKMLANLQLLREMDKIRMFQRLHLLDEFQPKRVLTKKEPKPGKKEAKLEQREEKREEKKEAKKEEIK